ncbi:MAG: hypothetical protein GEU83_13910 [Pseudonocardiaceae bacterium]|nr:hypothetical protein [Pseudonocardiaceae bacterium]
MEARRKPEELSEDERQQLHRAHQRVRNASHALEALTVIEKVRGRWAATPAPDDVLEAAAAEFNEACQELWSAQREMLGMECPAGVSSATRET